MTLSEELKRFRELLIQQIQSCLDVVHKILQEHVHFIIIRIMFLIENDQP